MLPILRVNNYEGCVLMKIKLIEIINGLLAVTLLSGCSSAGGRLLNKDTIDRCKLLADDAETTMYSRQYGLPMEKAIYISTDKKLTPDEGLREFRQALVISAYKEKQFSTTEERKIAVRDFREQILSGCLDEMRSQK